MSAIRHSPRPRRTDSLRRYRWGCGRNAFIIVAILGLSIVQHAGGTPALPAAASQGSAGQAGTPGQTPTPVSAAMVPTATTAPATPTPTLPSAPTSSPPWQRPPGQERPSATPTLTPPATPTPPARATPTPVISRSWPITQVLGYSTLEWPITAYQFGDGPTRLAFVGGIHGGYEWNTILLAYETIDHFAAHPEQVSATISLYVVPVANPDGLARVVGHAGRFTAAEVLTDTVPGRFNGNGVDLNRNWGQDWEPVGFWSDQEVNTGNAPFSEVETQILSDWLRTMDAVVFWHSASPGVYVAFCDDVYPPSQALAAVYARASGYPAYEGFYDYAVTGEATDWLACAGVPAVAVELTDHSATEGTRNLAAVRAVMAAYGDAEEP